MITIFGKSSCNWCDRAQELCNQYGLKYEYKSLDDRFDGAHNLLELKQLSEEYALTIKTVPQIWWGKKHLGGFEELANEIENTREFGQGGF